MQVAHLVHLIASVLMMTLFLVHMYLGTVGLDGAYQAMRTGWVDEAWAKEHHEYWYDDLMSGKIPKQRSKPTTGTETPPGSLFNPGTQA
jgi:formate dehydrogenase subunit gamma